MKREKRLIGIEELSYLICMPKQTIYNKLNNQTFPIKTYRQGRCLRWKQDEVVEYIEELKPVHEAGK